MSHASYCKWPIINGKSQTLLSDFFEDRGGCTQANFSAPAQEGNLFFLSERSARKKIHNFPIKSSHLCRHSDFKP